MQKNIQLHSLLYAAQIISRFARPLSTQSPSEWVKEAPLVLDDPEVKGPFDFTGREYLRAIIDDNADFEIHEQTLISGTGCGKTLTNIAGMTWKILFRPCRGLMVMPATAGEGGSRTFTTSRLIPALEATAPLRDLIPRGAERHNLSASKVRMNGAHFGFVGANSSAQIASNRCSDIRMDEADKFKGRLGNEAGTSSLVKERIEGVRDPQIFLNTTPTVDTGLGWRSLMRSDFRRRFLPCPHCNPRLQHRRLLAKGSISESNLRGWMVFVLAVPGGRTMFNIPTVLHDRFENGATIPQAVMDCDVESQRADGTFDLHRVYASARMVCPHCHGHILDKHKNWMDKNGLWLATRAGNPHHRGYHISSLYAPPLRDSTGEYSSKSTLGGRALKFLDFKEDSEGMKGFINSTIAEPDVMQEHGHLGIELQTSKFAQQDWVALMTVDVSKNWPFLWFIVRKWSAFKLQPPFQITNGRPHFAATLQQNPWLDERAQKIVANYEPAWLPFAELLRFDPCTGEFPAIDWLIAQGIVGENLVNLFRSRCNSNTLDLGRYIYGEMGVRLPRGGDSEAIAAGHCDTDSWDELYDLVQNYNVGIGLPTRNLGVLIDSGYAEENNPFVLRECYQTATQFAWYDPLTKQLYGQAIHAGCKPCPLDNWQPYKGYPEKTRWKIQGISKDMTYNFGDPFSGLAEADRRVIRVLSAATDVYFHQLCDTRDKQDAIKISIAAGRPYAGNTWTLSPEMKFHGRRGQFPDYQRHMIAKKRSSLGEIIQQGGAGGGAKKLWPDHLIDCETYQIPLARMLGFFSYEPEKRADS